MYSLFVSSNSSMSVTATVFSTPSIDTSLTTTSEFTSSDTNSFLYVVTE